MTQLMKVMIINTCVMRSACKVKQTYVCYEICMQSETDRLQPKCGLLTLFRLLIFPELSVSFYQMINDRSFRVISFHRHEPCAGLQKLDKYNRPKSDEHI
jgi:hypothetical protein